MRGNWLGVAAPRAGLTTTVADSVLTGGTPTSNGRAYSNVSDVVPGPTA